MVAKRTERVRKQWFLDREPDDAVDIQVAKIIHGFARRGEEYATGGMEDRARFAGFPHFLRKGNSPSGNRMLFSLQHLFEDGLGLPFTPEEQLGQPRDLQMTFSALQQKIGELELKISIARGALK